VQRDRSGQILAAEERAEVHIVERRSAECKGAGSLEWPGIGVEGESPTLDHAAERDAGSAGRKPGAAGNSFDGATAVLQLVQLEPR
jgi:hypothetical protein